MCLLVCADPTATLAAISARLATVIPPAESEIARINRDALLTVSKRYQQQAVRNRARDEQEASERKEGDDTQDDSCPHGLLESSSPSLPQRTGIPPALHESIIAEEWVNVHLETSGAFLLPATDLSPLLQKTSAALGGSSDDAWTEEEAFAFRRRGDNGPLGRAGIDRSSLYRLGMPKELVDRLYRALYVYTNGFHSLITEIAAHCPPLVERHVSSNVWLTFLLLLEQCEDGKYEMAMLKFKQATLEWRRQMQGAFESEKAALEAQLLATNASLTDEAQRSAEKSDAIAKLAADAAAASRMISSQHAEIVAQAEQLRVLRLEILVHEDDERKLNEQLDDMRRDFEVSNAERVNALAERFALEEELRKLQLERDRVEAEKAAYAKRMHEGLFMNQALRATNEALKQHTVVLAMEKDKVSSERDGLQAQIGALQQDLRGLSLQKVHVEQQLIDAQRKHQHLEERVQTMKEQFELEVAANSTHVQEIARLKREVDEEKVKAGVLDAKCSLLTAEKQNTGMRAQDKLRIERLLNQKLELENAVEALKLDRAKDQEQIWNLRASLEALDTEMQHSKRVFSAGQQAFLHSERTCEQLRNQLQEAEKSYDKASKSLSSLRERFKLFEENSREQMTKLEVELKVTSAQLREVSYANRDNAALIAELNKALEAAAKESMSAMRLQHEAEQRLVQLQREMGDLQRDKAAREEQRTASKHAIEGFVRSLQHILALVKLDEYPFDEALRELLRLAREAFGRDLDLDRVLDDEDEVEEFEEELDDDDVRDAQRSRRKLRKNGLLPPSSAGADDAAQDAGEGDDDEADGERHRSQITSMSKFRKSKLDKQVKQLQRDVGNKSDLIRSLEGVLCEQAEQLAQLTRVTEQQDARLKAETNRIGMLLADGDATAIALAGARAAQRYTELEKRRAEATRDVEIERRSRMQRALEDMQRQYDMQGAANEDLLGRIWREYEHYLLMLSLRRDEAVQATVTTADMQSQTLVPHRNPATERARVAAMHLPATSPTATAFEDVLQQINNHAKALLPEVATELSSLHFTASSSLPAQQGSGGGLQSPVPVVHPAQRVGGGGRIRRVADAQHRKRYDRSGRQTEQLLMGLPLLDHQHYHQQQHQAHPPHIIRHVNEFGVRQDVLVSPVYPPYFTDGATRQPPPAAHSKTPKKPEHRHRRYMQQRQSEQGDERCSSPTQPTSKDPRRRSPQSGRRRAQRRDLSPDDSSSAEARPGDMGDTGLRYHRGFLRTGMEVLKRSVAFPEDEDEEEEDDNGEDEDDSLSDEGPSRHRRARILADFGASLSPRSPGRLESAIRGYQNELDEQQTEQQQQQQRLRRRPPASKDEQADDGVSLDADVLKELSGSPFVPAVLYPLHHQ